MAQKIIQGSETLGRQIKSRRNELGLTIEEAAARANVGTKTWCRYEAGESIRWDKGKGICRALNWYAFPEQQEEEQEGLSIQEYKEHEAWSVFLEEGFGERAALSFAAGSDILLDHISEDMEELVSMPSGTHIGQLSTSWLYGTLPEQFLTYYDFEFLYHLKCTLYELRQRAKRGDSMTAHSVLEELVLYLCSQEGDVFIELCSGNAEFDEEEESSGEDWVFDLFDDIDLITFLYSDLYLEEDHPYHFSHWSQQQFYMNPEA